MATVTNDHGCSCARKLRNPVWIGCDFCDLWWHTICCNLKGITKIMADTIKQWKCPSCLGLTLEDGVLKIQAQPVLPETPKRTPGNDCTTISTIMREELHKVTDLIKKDVAEELRKVVVPELKETITTTMDAYTSEANTARMNWSAALAKNLESTKTTIDTTMTQAVQQHQETIVNTAMAKQDTDNYERARRKRNVVLSGVPESTTTNNFQRICEEKGIAACILNIDEKDVVRAFRGGQRKPVADVSDSYGPRPLIVVLSTPHLAQQCCYYGSGRKYIMDGTEYWSNEDLIKIDRLAARDARLAKKTRDDNATKKRDEATTNCTTSTTQNSTSTEQSPSTSTEQNSSTPAPASF